MTPGANSDEPRRDIPTGAPGISATHTEITIHNQHTGKNVDARPRKRALSPPELPLRVGSLRRLPDNMASRDEEVHRRRDLVGGNSPDRADLGQIPTAIEPVVAEATTGPLDARMGTGAIRSDHAVTSASGALDVYAADSAASFIHAPVEVGLCASHVPSSGGSMHGSDCDPECAPRSK